MDGDAENRDRVFRVAVLGGGLAGISAARVLSSQFGNANVVVLEAAPSLGGRIQNVSGIAPWPVEIGPEFLHGSKSSSVKDIADEMGCALRELNFRFPPDYYYIGHERRLLSNKEADEHPDIQRVHEIFEALCEDDSSVPDMSMAEYLHLKGANCTVMQLAQSIYGNDFGCSLDKLGVHECIREAQHWIYGDKYLILDRPLQSIVDYMSQGLNARLNWVVSNVEYPPNDTIQLHSADGRVVQAEYIILTFPLTILQQGLVSFNPPLPDWKLQAVQAIGMSNVVKVVLAFCQPFWPKGIFDVVCSDCFLPEVWITEYPLHLGTDSIDPASSHVPLGEHVVIGFIAGEAANALVQLPEGEVFRKALAQLDVMFAKSELSAEASTHGQQGTSGSFTLPNHSQEKLKLHKGLKSVDHGSPCTQLSKSSEFEPKVFTKNDLLRSFAWTPQMESWQTRPASFFFQGGLIVNWAKQNFIRGGYSHPSVNAQGAREALAKPLDRIYFAGEATHPGVNPCLQAAIDTGQRAAHQMIVASTVHSKL